MLTQSPFTISPITSQTRLTFFRTWNAIKSLHSIRDRSNKRCCEIRYHILVPFMKCSDKKCLRPFLFVNVRRSRAWPRGGRCSVSSLLVFYQFRECLWSEGPVVISSLIKYMSILPARLALWLSVISVLRTALRSLHEIIICMASCSGSRCVWVWHVLCLKKLLSTRQIQNKV